MTDTHTETQKHLDTIYRGIDKATQQGSYSLAEAATLAKACAELKKSINNELKNETNENLENKLNLLNNGLNKGNQKGSYSLDEAFILKNALMNLTANINSFYTNLHQSKSSKLQSIKEVEEVEVSV